MDQPGRDEQIRRAYPMLFRAAMRCTGDEHDATDVTQEAVCRAVAGWDGFDGRARRTTWLYGILINCVRDWARRKAGDRQVAFDQWEALSVGGGGDPTVARAQAREHAEALRRAIRELSDALRGAFVLTVMDGLTYEEAAEVLAVPPGTIASRVNLARGQVADAMRKAFPE